MTSKSKSLIARMKAWSSATEKAVPGMESVGVMRTMEMRSNGSPVDSIEMLARDCVDGLIIVRDPRTGVPSTYSTEFEIPQTP